MRDYIPSRMLASSADTARRVLRVCGDSTLKPVFAALHSLNTPSVARYSGVFSFSPEVYVGKKSRLGAIRGDR